jgi:hypothetical protein
MLAETRSCSVPISLVSKYLDKFKLLLNWSRTGVPVSQHPFQFKLNLKGPGVLLVLVRIHE